MSFLTFSGHEQALLDDISDMFGPRLEDILMKQDAYQVATETIPSNYPARLVSMDMDELVATTRPDSSMVYIMVTTQVPVQHPRMLLGPSIRVQWLRELRIVFRATEDCSFLFGFTGSEATSSTPSTRPTVVDFSWCRTLEVLSIEDYDQDGLPQRLRHSKESGMRLADPFHRSQGIKLPSYLRSLEMIGFSANRFNFGWLTATPKLERLQILGVHRRDANPEKGDVQDTQWDWEGVQLPCLRYLALHHTPARHFRFEILRRCPRLEVLDVRKIHPRTVVMACLNHEATISFNTHGVLGMIPKGVSIPGKPLLKKIRLEILPVQDGILAPRTADLTSIIQAFFPQVVYLRVDGFPVRSLIEATSGPLSGLYSSVHCDGSIEQSQLLHVWTREKASTQDLTNYGLLRTNTSTTSSIERATAGSSYAYRADQRVAMDVIKGRSNMVRYTIDNKEWVRFAIEASHV
ncbi:hypothetical protein B0O80DRAFT_503967 [Mortierella sp. GBAus27b]|nr:hypothetical protein BGX31_009404 [Mortierella sp. GBA43]KAI8345904.1 hypothetical protein B0O80DRAFT_503967 [Mortierella sp. GBAus27b]